MMKKDNYDEFGFDFDDTFSDTFTADDVNKLFEAPSANHDDDKESAETVTGAFEAQSEFGPELISEPERQSDPTSDGDYEGINREEEDVRDISPYTKIYADDPEPQDQAPIDAAAIAKKISKPRELLVFAVILAILTAILTGVYISKYFSKQQIDMSDYADQIVIDGSGFVLREQIGGYGGASPLEYTVTVRNTGNFNIESLYIGFTVKTEYGSTPSCLNCSVGAGDTFIFKAFLPSYMAPAASGFGAPMLVSYSITIDEISGRLTR